jgi:translation elongation factor EF-Ts
MIMPSVKRVLLKLSGEVLMGNQAFGIDPAFVAELAGEVKAAKDNALLSQLFVMDNKTSIADVVAQAGKSAGASIVLKDYVRFQLGEGIEKEATDFAAEVAAAVKG